MIVLLVNTPVVNIQRSAIRVRRGRWTATVTPRRCALPVPQATSRLQAPLSVSRARLDLLTTIAILPQLVRRALPVDTALQVLSVAPCVALGQ